MQNLICISYYIFLCVYILRGGSSQKSDRSIFKDIAYLGESGGMPPRKIFEIWSPEMRFPAFWALHVTIKFVRIVLISQAKIRKISKSKVSLAYILTYDTSMILVSYASLRISLSINWIPEYAYHLRTRVSYEHAAYHMNARIIRIRRIRVSYEYAYKQILGRYKTRYIYTRVS
jgi:hypothetical protein